MPVPTNDPTPIAATGKSGTLAPTERHGPTGGTEGDMADLWGAMRGSVTVAPGTDLTAGTFSLLDADA